MEELTLIENLEKYPYLKEHLDTTLIDQIVNSIYLK